MNLSGGLDSSLLLGLIHELQGADSDVKVFTFATGDSDYDELPWVEQMLAQTNHPLTVGWLSADRVPELAREISESQDEPFGGLPTLAYANLFAQAHAAGIKVLLDGQGMDEAWAGYDYYGRIMDGNSAATVPTVQGTRHPIMQADCLLPEFRTLAPPRPGPPAVFPDALRCLQYRDARHTKLPRALRFNDRVSMASSAELREPFLDHRLFELALKQPAERKRTADSWQEIVTKKLPKRVIPDGLRQAPKRPVQTPQREWLRGPLRDWATERIEVALDVFGGRWLNTERVHQRWEAFQRGESDNSFFVWQWISLGFSNELMNSRTHVSSDV